MPCCVFPGDGLDATSAGGKTLEALVMATGEPGCTTIRSNVFHRCVDLLVKPFGIRNVGKGGCWVQVGGVGWERR